ncbi:hepatoma-derived growth factor-related protein 2-like [Nilaparvata lugens]|uniref:hepatoma-derived growth factor-related protein 2-like n=1 Tax=Nilaparvata lugens TaxID=108931 RepID=UPI00193E5E25|nr:hepatoma-derived growth factor-related protein 2-like [Nilaparvata lugens]
MDINSLNSQQLYNLLNDDQKENESDGIADSSEDEGHQEEEINLHQDDLELVHNSESEESNSEEDSDDQLNNEEDDFMIDKDKITKWCPPDNTDDDQDFNPDGDGNVSTSSASEPQTPAPRSRKRLRKEGLWRKNKAKSLRDSGKEYVGFQKVLKRAKSFCNITEDNEGSAYDENDDSVPFDVSEIEQETQTDAAARSSPQPVPPKQVSTKEVLSKNETTLSKKTTFRDKIKMSRKKKNTESEKEKERIRKIKRECERKRRQKVKEDPELYQKTTSLPKPKPKVSRAKKDVGPIWKVFLVFTPINSK